MSAQYPLLLSVNDLAVHYTARGGPFADKHVLRAVDGVSFDVPRGGSFGIVGESGSGKSTTAAAIMRLTAIAAGRMTFDGLSLDKLEGEALRTFRRRMQIVFQDPYASLDPRTRVGEIVKEPLVIQNIGSAREQEERVAEFSRSSAFDRTCVASSPISFQAASARELASRARSPPIRTSLSATSRYRRSTSQSRRRSSIF